MNNLIDFFSLPILNIPLLVWVIAISLILLITWFLVKFELTEVNLLSFLKFTKKPETVKAHNADKQPISQSLILGEAFRKYFATILARPFYPVPIQLEYVEKIKKGLEKSLVLALVGSGGVGKTTVAGEFIRQSPTLGFYKPLGDSAKQTTFEDSRIQPVDEPLKLEWEELINTMLRQLGAKSLVTKSISERENFIRKNLKLQKYVVLVDNLESSNNTRDIVVRLQSLLQNTNSRGILTHRYRNLGDITGLYQVNVEGLSDSDSYRFLECELQTRGHENILSWLKEKGDSEDNLREVITFTRGLPLALQLVVGLRTTLPLPSVLDVLHKVTADTRVEQIYEFLFARELEILSDGAFNLLISVFSKQVGFYRSEIENLTQKSPEDVLRELTELSLLSLVYSINRERSETKSEDYFFIHPMLHELLKNNSFMQGILRRTVS
jgi:hypothetical protein